MCIETYTEYSGFQFQDNDVSQCGSSPNLKAEDLLLIEKITWKQRPKRQDLRACKIRARH